MRIERQQVGTVNVLSPIGALVDHDTEKFRAELLESVKAPDSRLVVSVAEVPYMDSAALDALLEASDVLAERAATLKLASVPATCREILELTGLAGRFDFFPDVRDAVRSFL